MGNLLCVPKSSKRKGTQKVPKKRSLKKWLFQRNKVEVHVENEGNKADTQESSGNSDHKVIIKGSDAYNKDTSTTDGITETHQPEYHTDPVVSNSILLRSFDEELECNTESSRTSEESGDVSRIGEDSISSTEQQQQPEKNTDDKQQLEEPQDIFSTGEANVSATEDPAFENKPRNNKEVDQQSEKSDGVTVVRIRNISATEESHFEEKSENSRDREQQSEKSDDVCSIGEANIPAAFEPHFEEKQENKPNGEQQSEESDDDFSGEKGLISPTNSLSVEEKSESSAEWDQRSVNSGDAPSVSKESLSATKDLCIQGNMSPDNTEPYEEHVGDTIMENSLPDTGATNKDKTDEVNIEKLVHKEALVKCDEVVYRLSEGEVAEAGEEDKILTKQLGTGDITGFREVKLKTKAVEVVNDLSATQVKTADEKKMSLRILEVKLVQGHSKPDDDTNSPTDDDFHDKGHDEQRSRVFNVDEKKTETKTANDDKKESGEKIFTKDITPATYEPDCTNFASVCSNKRAKSTELHLDTNVSRSTKQCAQNMLNGVNNPKDDLQKTQANVIPSTLKRDYNQKDKLSLMAAHSCPAIPKQPKQSAYLKELTKMLEALSAIKVPPRSDTQQSTSFSRNLPSPQPTTSGLSSGPGHYKSEEGIQKWLQKSTSCSIESVKTEENQTVDQQKRKVSDFEVSKRKVCDFEVPKKPPRKPPTPLVLKKPSPHLYNLPSIAKTDLEENGTVKWMQREPTGPQAKVLWASRPTSYNVKFPSLPKRLLEREGSIDKMRDDCVLPQTKQIETLKREYGRFPGLKVPKALRNKYSFDVQQQDSSINKGDNNERDNGGGGHDYTNDDDINTRHGNGNDDDNYDGKKIMKNL